MNTDRIAPLITPILRRMLAGPQAARRSQFDHLLPATGRIVFLGDSITEQGMWDEWFPEWPVINRGIGGDTAGGVTKRLDSAINGPLAVSLLIGTNDLTGLGRSRDVGAIAAQVRLLVRRIRDRAPEAHIVINSVMPRSEWFAPRVTRLNEHYRVIARDVDAVYLDLWPALAGPSGELRTEFTRDGLHLTGAGYRAWVDALRPVLRPVGEPS